MNSSERSMLYYFLDAVGGAPDEFYALLQMARAMAQKRGASQDYRDALAYVEELVKNAGFAGKDPPADVGAFKARLAAAVREQPKAELAAPQAEAREAVRRAMR